MEQYCLSYFRSKSYSNSNKSVIFDTKFGVMAQYICRYDKRCYPYNQRPVAYDIYLPSTQVGILVQFPLQAQIPMAVLPV